MINKIHECDIKVDGYFHIGGDYTVIRSPYIYKFRLIEGLDYGKYPKIKTNSVEKLDKTTIIKRTIIVAINNDNPDYLYQIVNSLYYKEHIDTLSEFLNKDLTGLASTYLYLL